MSKTADQTSLLAQHHRHEVHKRENPLRDVILGGQDGLVNALGIILGISAATGDVKILIATVLAATFAESLSMGAVAYTSALSQKDYYDSERAKEYKEVEEIPEMEKQEVREIYAKKGFSGAVLDEIVETTCKDKKVWVDFMMAEELHIAPVKTKEVLKSAVIVTIATMIGHFVPLLPFFFFVHGQGVIISVIISAVTLFVVGWYQAVTLIGSWWKSGVRMVLIGLGAAFVGFFIAKLFHAAG
ncbi:MAG TPA: VIT1/CCC1 transporter family protein [Candidatus Saccharimonadales bacterium]|nr:VIT1/CCC1 transporter family protein [Candidatus Saccharimonadales bacterium]